MWISQPNTCAEKALSLGEGQKEGEDSSWNPSWLRDGVLTPGPNVEMIGQRQPRKLPPYKQSKLLLLGGTHSELSCVLFHMYFVFSTCTLLFLQVFCFFYTYFASNKHLCLFHNLDLFAEFFLQRRQEPRSLFQLFTAGITMRNLFFY